MATFEINCPECDKEISVPDEAVGKKIRCKGCEHVFVVARPKTKAKAAPAKAAKGAKAVPEKTAKAAPPKGKPAKEEKPAPKKGADEDDEGGAYGLSHFDMSYRCPDCANPMESEDAIVCLHCGYNTQTRTKPRRRKVKEVTGGDQFLWLLPGILAVFFIFISLGYVALHHWVFPPAIVNDWDKLMEEHNNRFEVIDKTTGNAGMEYLFHPAIELWLVIMVLFMDFAAARFAIKRLFIDNKPPEIEVK